MMARDLVGRIAVITGASSGIGHKTALAFAHEGIHCVLAARRADRLAQVAQEVRALGAAALVLPTDVAQPDQIHAMVTETVRQFGRIDILVNNAGFGIFARVDQTTAEEIQRIFAVNFFGTFHATQAVLPVMRRQGHGHIINVSSVAGKRGLPFSGAYCATKFAMNGLTESLRAEMAGTGIQVSLVCPVGTLTEFFEVAESKIDRKALPMGFMQTADHVANRILKCVRRPRAEVLPLRLSRIYILMSALAPGLVDRAMRSAVKRFRRGLQTEA